MKSFIAIGFALIIMLTAVLIIFGLQLGFIQPSYFIVEIWNTNSKLIIPSAFLFLGILILIWGISPSKKIGKCLY